MRESALVRAVRAAVLARWPDAYVRKLSDRSRRGLPDLLVIAAGVSLLVETKAVYGRVGPLQVLEANAVVRAGGNHAFARSPGAVVAELEELIKKRGLHARQDAAR